MSRLYSINGQQASLLALAYRMELEVTDDDLDNLADLKPGESYTLEESHVEVKREE